MKGLKICRIFGIDIELHWSVLLLAILLGVGLYDYFSIALKDFSSWVYATLTATAVVLFIFSILFHELAHSLVAQGYGIKMARITLLLIGGLAQFEGDSMPNKPKEEFWVAAAGPLSSFFLSALFAVLFYVGYAFAPFLTPLFYYLGYINVILAVFNLFPLFPLDGGRILRAFLWWRKNDLVEATRIVAALKVSVGAILAGIIYLLYGWINFLWIGALIVLFIFPQANREYAFIFVREKSKGVKIGEIMEYLLADEGSGNKNVCSPDDDANEVFGKMQSLGTEYFMVKKDGAVAGVISISNIIAYLRAKSAENKTE